MEHAEYNESREGCREGHLFLEAGAFFVVAAVLQNAYSMRGRSPSVAPILKGQFVAHYYGSRPRSRVITCGIAIYNGGAEGRRPDGGPNLLHQTSWAADWKKAGGREGNGTGPVLLGGGGGGVYVSKPRGRFPN